MELNAQNAGVADLVLSVASGTVVVLSGLVVVISVVLFAVRCKRGASPASVSGEMGTAEAVVWSLVVGALCYAVTWVAMEAILTP